MKKLKLLILLTAISFGTLLSQEKSFSNVKRISMNSVQAISNDGNIEGYYAFYFLEKADRKNNNYLLEIMDSKLKTTQQINITKSKNTILLEGKHNGTHFCFSFINTKDKTIESDIYNNDGTKTGSYNIDDLDNVTYQTIYNYASLDDSYYSGTLFPIKEKGFIITYAIKDDGVKYMNVFFDNTGEKQWTNKSNNKDKSYETFSVFFSNEKFTIGNFNTRPKLMSMKDATSNIMIIDSETGKKVSTIELNEDGKHLIPSGFEYDNNDDQIFAFGEVFGDKNGKVDVKDKIGFFVYTYSPDGKKTGGKICTWKEDVAKKIGVNKKGKIGNGISVMIHKVIKTSEGKYIAIGEQFNKEVSAGGVAIKALGGSASAMKIALYNFMSFEFDKDFNLEDVQVYTKDKDNIILPEGYGIASEDKLGYLLKLYGWFNYNYTTQNKDKTNFSSAYTVYNKGSENKGKRYTVGVITSDDEGKIKQVDYDLKTKPTKFAVLPAKPGYVMIFEYFRKEKKAEIRLEKLDI